MGHRLLDPRNPDDWASLMVKPAQRVVKPARRSRPKLIKFKKPIVHDDSKFVETLVWVLNQARTGKINGYSMVFIVETPDGHKRTIESAMAFKDIDNMTVLGMIRRMEHNYMRRTWPEDDMIDRGTA